MSFVYKTGLNLYTNEIVTLRDVIREVESYDSKS